MEKVLNTSIITPQADMIIGENLVVGELEDSQMGRLGQWGHKVGNVIGKPIVQFEVAKSQLLQTDQVFQG